jgi:hypothetical protein
MAFFAIRIGIILEIKINLIPTIDSMDTIETTQICHSIKIVILIEM